MLTSAHNCSRASWVPGPAGVRRGSVEATSVRGRGGTAEGARVTNPGINREAQDGQDEVTRYRLRSRWGRPAEYPRMQVLGVEEMRVGERLRLPPVDPRSLVGHAGQDADIVGGGYPDANRLVV